MNCEISVSIIIVTNCGFVDKCWSEFKLIFSDTSLVKTWIKKCCVKDKIMLISIFLTEAETVRSAFGPFVEAVKFSNLHDWLVCWEHQGNIVSSSSIPSSCFLNIFLASCARSFRHICPLLHWASLMKHFSDINLQICKDN